GAPLENFFSRYVRGREELDYNAALNAVGLQLGENSVSPPAERLYLGANIAQEGDRLMIKTITSGSPAYDQGLNTGDQIVALDGHRVNRDTFLARLGAKRVGNMLNLTIFRADDLRACSV